jgi:hypothetical protein
VLGLAWHDAAAAAAGAEARRAAAAALSAYGREEAGVPEARRWCFDGLPAHDRARLERLFREGRGIARKQARARQRYRRLSAQRLLARVEAMRKDEVILRGLADARTAGGVTVLRAWAASFRQVEGTFWGNEDVTSEDGGAYGGGGCGGGGRGEEEAEKAEGHDEAAAMDFADRLCFDIVYEIEAGRAGGGGGGGAAAAAKTTKETLSFRTRRGYKSVRVWIDATTTTATTTSVDTTPSNHGQPAAKSSFSFRSDMPLRKLGRDGAAFLNSARPSALFVSAFISDCVWPDLVPSSSSSSSPSSSPSSPSQLGPAAVCGAIQHAV